MKTSVKNIWRTFGAGYVSKRNNKRKAPTKYEMISFIKDYRNINYAMDTPYNIIKKVFSEKGGFEWWENK